MKNFFIVIIKIYQYLISPLIGKNCRFYPTCSEYSIISIRQYGSLKGIYFTIKRILKCHPFHKGGVDMP